MARILSIDDDMAVTVLLKELLTGMGHEFRFALDPTGIMTAVNGFVPDLIILDMQMPAGGSPLAMRVIESNTEFRNAKLICFSSLEIEKQKELVPPGPGRFYMQKSFDLTALRQGIEQILAA